MHDGAYRFGEFSISPADRRVARHLAGGSETVALPPKAFDALHLLVRNHGTLVSRTEIITTLWPGIHVSEANLTNIIVLLRRLLGRESIQTVSKFGYRFTLLVSGEPGVKQAAYASFVRGKELLTQRSLESILAARDLFWITLADDPSFAPAWAWLGRCCRLLEKFRGEKPTNPSLAEAAFHRAFIIDPDLACAHQFYTQLQVDSGHALDALARLAGRLKQHGEDPETLTGLVQVLRVCGLLDESVAAHERAIALDPTIKTSVAHTHFLLGDYARVFETYSGNQLYLDAAAWTALGNHERAVSSLRARIGRPDLGPLMFGLMASLLAVIEGRAAEALDLIEHAAVLQEPEVRFYLARHCGMLNELAPTVEFLRAARMEGFHCPTALENDIAFATLRRHTSFQQELQEARRLTAQASRMVHKEHALKF
jgi:DNA-binding winged helix-turn-helix (wHTH) protein